MSVDELVRSGRVEREALLDPDGSYEAAWPLSDGPDGVAGAPEP